MPLLSTLGAASAQGFGEIAIQQKRLYVEDVFSTNIYTCNGASQTLTSGVNLSTNGGFIWFKDRTSSGTLGTPAITDTVTGLSNYLIPTQQTQQQTWGTDAPVATTTGFTLPLNTNIPYTNYQTGDNYVAWTFRKAEKFCDVVTWTGDGTNNRQIAHGLKSTPGMIIIKATSGSSNWSVSYNPFAYWTGSSYTGLYLNTSAPVGSSTANGQGISAVSSTTFTIENSVSPALEFFPNSSGVTYVAYVFANNAGGFGADGTQSVIKCGYYTGTGSSGNNISLGWEPQYILIKQVDTSGSWVIIDNMRGFPVNYSDAWLYANLTNSESAITSFAPTATGFVSEGATLNTSGGTYIYMAIRRGPMKTPTSGTSVFYSLNRTGTGGSATLTGASFAPDLYISKATNQATYNPIWYDKLRSYYYLLSSTSGNEGGPGGVTSYNNNGVSVSGGGAYGLDGSGDSIINYMFSRAPGFMDEICYTGNGAFNSINHNLGVVPELIIAKARSNSEVWYVDRPNNDGKTGVLNDAAAWFANWPSGQPTATSTQFRKTIDTNTYTYVAYLFASCPGVSKIGTYTGTGSTQTINCGFTGGARFVLIKRLDSIGNWWIWDTARGMVSGTDPRFPLNIADAQTNTNWVYTTTGGFQVVTADSTVNASGGSYIYLAIA